MRRASGGSVASSARTICERAVVAAGERDGCAPARAALGAARPVSAARSSAASAASRSPRRSSRDRDVDPDARRGARGVVASATAFLRSSIDARPRLIAVVELGEREHRVVVVGTLADHALERRARSRRIAEVLVEQLGILARGGGAAHRGSSSERRQLGEHAARAGRSACRRDTRPRARRGRTDPSDRDRAACCSDSSASTKSPRTRSTMPRAHHSAAAQRGSVSARAHARRPRRARHRLILVVAPRSAIAQQANEWSCSVPSRAVEAGALPQLDRARHDRRAARR